LATSKKLAISQLPQKNPVSGWALVKSGETAKIDIGKDAYVQAGTYQGGEWYGELETVQTGTIMEITPQVLSTGSIAVSFSVEQSYFVQPAYPNVVLTEDGSSVSTNVVVKSGETIVVGGLNFDMEKRTKSGVPLLREIPLLGYKSTSPEKREVVIYITPYAVE
jgi:general secretion pathway protein D